MLLENKKFKVAILEIDNKNHTSLIYNWLKVAEINEWEATLFTNEEIYDNIKDDIKDIDNQVFIKKESESVLRFLFRAKKLLKENQCDVLLILTLQTYFLEFLYVRFAGLKVGLTIHNARTWFRGNAISKTSHIVKRLTRIIWKQRAHFFIVNSENMRQYIENSFHVSKKVLVMPFSLRRNRFPGNNSMKVVYPGMISTHRKKYDNFIQLAEQYKDVEFLLLGAPDTREGGLQVLEKIRAKGLKNLRYFTSYVNNEIFKKEMNSSSLIFCELKIDYRNSDFDEVYGKTKDSGISYLMYEYGLPGILNVEFSNLPYLERGTTYFRDYNDLKDQFKNLTSDSSTMEILKRDLESAIRDVNIENTAKQLREVYDLSG